MARMSRVVAIGYPHHITQRGVRSLDIFRSDEDRGDYLRFVKEETDRFGVKILSWCLMTNHVHFIAVPTGREKGTVPFSSSRGAVVVKAKPLSVCQL
jgi:putative transposase